MATGAVWEDVPGEGLVLQDPGTSGLPRGTMIPWNADAEHYALTRNLRIEGTTDEGTPAATAGLAGDPAPDWAHISPEDIAPGGGTEGLAELARADSDKTEIVNRNTGAVTTIGDDTGDEPSATELRSASEIVRDILSTYGLGELLDDPDLDLINLWVTTGDAAAVWARVRQSDPYKDRFPGMAALSEAGRAVSEATYIELERGYIEIMNSAGIDPGFYDEPSDFGALIGGDVSVNEFNQRVALAVEATTRMTAEVREELSTYYPEITDGDLTAYYLDPETATNIFEEREKIGAARIGGIARETGFGSVSRQTAERLRAAGVTETAARRGFQAIAPSTLAEETASESLDRDPVTGRPMVSLAVVGQQKPGDITPEELIGGQFGTDPQAAKRIEARRQRRLAAFAQRGGPAMTGGGYTGLGTAT